MAPLASLDVEKFDLFHLFFFPGRDRKAQARTRTSAQTVFDRKQLASVPSIPDHTLSPLA